MGELLPIHVMLERRMRELSAQAVATQDPEQLQAIVTELREALHEHDERLHKLLAEYPFAP